MNPIEVWVDYWIQVSDSYRQARKDLEKRGIDVPTYINVNIARFCYLAAKAALEAKDES